MWPFIVRKMLQEETAAGALAVLKSAKLAGAHNYLIMDRAGRGYNVEATATAQHVTALEDAPVVHANHCTVSETREAERTRDPASQASSEAREARAETLLGGADVTLDDLQALTRDPPVCVRAAPPKHVETCGAAIMRPATGDFWAVWGLPTENEYEHFTVA